MNTLARRMADETPNESSQDLIRAMVSNAAFPCVGAKTALAQNDIRIVEARSIFCPADDQHILESLYSFIESFDGDKQTFRSLIVVFKDAETLPEEVFEKCLWKRLQALNTLDTCEWDKSVSSDPQDNNFSFSIGGRAFYVIGMHPGSSRKARQFAYPALVFNLHEQFEQLRSSGKYNSFRQLVRRRDIAFSGSSNPMLADFKAASEAIQYSGRQVDPNAWKCPFHAG